MSTSSAHSKSLRPPIFNPYHKFTQPDFDHWINGLTGALRSALGHEELPRSPSPPHATHPDHPLTDPDDDPAADDSFAELKARRAKGKARDPREGPGLGARSQPIEIPSDSGEEEQLVEDDVAPRTTRERSELSSTHLPARVSPGEPLEDEDGNGSGEDAHVDVIRRSSPDPNSRYLQGMAKLGYPLADNRTHTGAEESATELQAVFEGDMEEQDERNAQDFPPQTAASQPPDLPNAWQGPQTYAEDYYSAGDIREGALVPRGMSPSDLTPIHDNDVGMVLTPGVATPSEETPPPGEPQTVDVDMEGEGAEDFPPLRETSPPIDIPNPWEGPETFAEDFYSGGDVREGVLGPYAVTPSSLTPAHDATVLSLVGPSNTAPQTPPRKATNGDLDAVRASRGLDLDLPGSSPLQSSPPEHFVPLEGLEDDPVVLPGHGAVARSSTLAGPAPSAQEKGVPAIGHLDWNWPPAFPAGTLASGPGHLATPPDEDDSEVEEVEGPLPLGTSDLAEDAVYDLSAEAEEGGDDSEGVRESVEAEAEGAREDDACGDVRVLPPRFGDLQNGDAMHEPSFGIQDFSLGDAGGYASHAAAPEAGIEFHGDIFQPLEDDRPDFGTLPIPSMDTVQLSEEQLSDILNSLCGDGGDETGGLHNEVSFDVDVEVPAALEAQVGLPVPTDETIAAAMEFMDASDVQPLAVLLDKHEEGAVDRIVVEVESEDEADVPADEEEEDAVSVSGDVSVELVPYTVEEVETEGRLTEEPEETRQLSIGITVELIDENEQHSLSVEDIHHPSKKDIFQIRVDETSPFATPDADPSPAGVQDQHPKLLSPSNSALAVPMPVSADPTVRDPTSLSATPVSPLSPATTPLQTRPGSPTPPPSTPQTSAVPVPVLRALQGREPISRSGSSGLFTPYDEQRSLPASAQASEAGDVVVEGGSLVNSEMIPSPAPEPALAADVASQPVSAHSAVEGEDILASEKVSVEPETVLAEPAAPSIDQLSDSAHQPPSEIASTPTELVHEVTDEKPPSFAEGSSMPEPIPEAEDMSPREMHDRSRVIDDAIETAGDGGEERIVPGDAEPVAEFSTGAPPVQDDDEGSFQGLDLSYPQMDELDELGIPEEENDPEDVFGTNAGNALVDDAKPGAVVDADTNSGDVSPQDTTRDPLGSLPKDIQDETDPFKLMGNDSAVAPGAVEEEDNVDEDGKEDGTSADVSPPAVTEALPANDRETPEKETDRNTPVGESSVLATAESARSPKAVSGDTGVLSQIRDSSDPETVNTSEKHDIRRPTKRKRRSSAPIPPWPTRSTSMKGKEKEKAPAHRNKNTGPGSNGVSAVDTASETGSTSSGASAASRMLVARSRTTSRASSIVSNSTHNDVSSQPSPTTAKPVPPPLFHTHSTIHHHHHRLPAPPVVQLYHRQQSPLPSAASKEILSESSSSQPRPSQKVNPVSSSPVTRSNCRFHKISVSHEDRPRIYFLVPGCSLTDHELMKDHEIEDHGDPTLEDLGRKVDEIESLDFSSDLIGVLRQLVGVDLLRENEVFYVPQDGEKYRRKRRRKSAVERSALGRMASRDSAAHVDTRVLISSPRTSKFSPTSSVSRAPISAVSTASASTSTTSRLRGSERDTIFTYSGSEGESTDIEDKDDSPKTKRHKKVPSVDVDSNNGDTGLQSVASSSNTRDATDGHLPKAKRTRRSKRISVDASAYKPEPESGADSAEDDQSTTKGRRKKAAKRGVKRTRTAEGVTEGTNEEEVPKLKKPRIRAVGRIDNNGEDN